MNDIKLKHILPQTGEIVVGCMRFDSLTPEQIADMIDRLAGEGILHYDHADIYGNGICEEKFGQALQLCQTPREQLILQSKWIRGILRFILNTFWTPWTEFWHGCRPGIWIC